jgi:gamma-glutamyltranspeptidase/glutathione hydrolase
MGHYLLIPGFVAGIRAMHERFGTIPFQGLLEAPIGLAKDGFLVSSGLANSFRREWSRLSATARSALQVNGSFPSSGNLLREPNLAKTLTSIAETGSEVFYKGWIANKLVDNLSKLRAPIELEDMAQFEPEWCRPLRSAYHGATIYEMPPNSMCATTLLILKLLEGERLDESGPKSFARVSATLNVVKAAYQRRDAVLADPRFMPFSLRDFLKPNSPLPEPRKRDSRKRTQPTL